MIPWAAPTPPGPVVGRVVVPGSKSATARGYVLAALADGPSVLSGVLDARDTRLMRAALTALATDAATRQALPGHATPEDIAAANDIANGVLEADCRLLIPASL